MKANTYIQLELGNQGAKKIIREKINRVGKKHVTNIRKMSRPKQIQKKKHKACTGVFPPFKKKERNGQ